MSELGLYIGRRAVDIVEVSKTVAGPKIVNYGRKDLYEQPTKPTGPGKAPGGMKRAPMSPQERIITTIRALLREKKIKTKGVVSTLPADAITVRFFDMPRLPQREWETAVRFEAKKYIPFKMEEVISDFQVIENKLDPKKMSVVFVAAKRDVLNSQMLILAQAGLVPNAIDIIPFALKRVCKFTKELPDDSQTTVVVNVNQNSGFIAILKEGSLCLIRDVTLTGETKELLYESLMGEMRLSVGYFERQYPHASIDSVVFTGEGDFEGWDVSMSNELRLPVKISNPVKNIKGGEEVPGGYEIAMGLVLKSFQKETTQQVNLISDIVAVREKQKLYTKVVAVEVVLAVLLLSFLHQAMLGKVKKIRGQLKTLEEEGSQFSSELNSMVVPELEAKKEEIQKRINIFKMFVLDRVYWTFKFRDLAAMLPEKVWLTDIALDEEIKEGNILRFLMIEGISWVENESTSAVNEMRLINTYLANIKSNVDFLKGFQRIEGINIEKYKLGYADATKFRIILSNRR